MSRPTKAAPKPPKPQRTATSSEVADELDVEKRTVTRWAERGCPHKATKAGHLFNLPEVMAWLKESGLTGEAGRPTENVPESLAAAKLRKENALAAKHELWLERETGRLIPRADAENEVVRINTIVAQRLRQLPSTAAPGLVGRTAAEIESELEGHVRHIEEHLSGAAFDIPQDAGAKGGGVLEAHQKAQAVAVGGRKLRPAPE